MAFVIGDSCVSCGSCESQCPVGAISAGDSKYEIDESYDSIKILTDYTVKRNLVKAGGDADIARGAKMLIDDFRSCKIGNLTLENIE